MRKTFLHQCLLLLALWVTGATGAWAETFKLTITQSDFNTTSYAANNNEKTSNAVSTTDATKTYEVKWTSYQVYQNSSVMQWKKSEGYIYNSTDLGTITNVTVTSSDGTFTTYYGTSSQPSSSTTVGGGFFQVKVGSATGKSTKIEVTFDVTIKSDVETFKFDNLTPSVALSGGTATYTQTVNTTFDGTITYSLAEDYDGVSISGAEVTATKAGTYVVKAKGTGSATYNDTDETSYTLTVNPEAGTLGDIVFTPAAGEVIKGTKVSLSAYEAENIYYSVDGSDPATLYTEPIAITQALTLKAKAVKGEQEKTAEAAYTIVLPTEEVVIWEEDWSSGTQPNKPSEISNPNATYAASSTSTYLFNAVLAGGTSPELLVAKNKTTFTATINLNGFSGDCKLSFLSNKASLSVSTTTEGVTVSGTTGGTAGTESVYTITGIKEGTEKLILVFSTTGSDNVRLDNLKLTGTRVVVEPETPKFFIAGSEVSDNYVITEAEGVSLTIKETNGANIYYTTDGTEPTTASTKYSAALLLTEAGTIKAIANNKAGTSSVATLTLTKAVIPTPVITLSAENIEMEAGETGHRLTATATLGEKAFEGTIAFSSSSEDLTIDAEGYISCATVGTYTVTASIAASAGHYNAAQATCTVNVTPQTVKFIKVNEVEDGGQFLLVGTSTDGNSLHAATKTLNSTYLEQVDVTATDGIIKQLLENAFTITVADDVYTLQIDGKYLKSTEAKKVSLETDASNATAWSLYEKENQGYMFSTPSGDKTLYFSYNSSSPRFTTYDGTGQRAFNIYQLMPASVPVAVTAAGKGMATYYSQYALDFTGVSNIYAYTAEVSGSTITFTRQKGTVPAGTGLLLRNPDGEAAEANVPLATGEVADVENALLGTVNGIGALPTDGEGSTTNYILNAGAEGVGFYKAAGNAVGAHKAYLSVPAGASVRTFIAFNDETTGISSISSESTPDSRVYNMQGQQVARPTKGLYIVHGQKVVIK